VIEEKVVHFRICAEGLQRLIKDMVYEFKYTTVWKVCEDFRGIPTEIRTLLLMGKACLGSEGPEGPCVHYEKSDLDPDTYNTIVDNFCKKELTRVTEFLQNNYCEPTLTPSQWFEAGYDDLEDYQYSYRDSLSKIMWVLSEFSFLCGVLSRQDMIPALLTNLANRVKAQEKTYLPEDTEVKELIEPTLETDMQIKIRIREDFLHFHQSKLDYSSVEDIVKDYPYLSADKSVTQNAWVDIKNHKVYVIPHGAHIAMEEYLLDRGKLESGLIDQDAYIKANWLKISDGVVFGNIHKCTTRVMDMMDKAGLNRLIYPGYRGEPKDIFALKLIHTTNERGHYDG